MIETCETCRFWKTDNGVDGECRRNPPVGLNKFVGVSASAWCGEWQKKALPMVTKGEVGSTANMIEKAMPEIPKGGTAATKGK